MQAPATKQEAKNTEKTYGYTFDSNHEAMLEGRLNQIIGRIGQVQGNRIPGTLQGDCHSLVTEIQGFLHKWQTFNSYVEKAERLISDQKSVDLFVMKCLYRDFMKQADRLGFKNSTNIMEDWEKRFLGLSK